MTTADTSPIVRTAEHALELHYALELAAEMLAQYHQYGETMRAIGRGFHPTGISSNGFTEEYAMRFINKALSN